MRYTASISPGAFRQVRSLAPTARRRVQAVIDLLTENPRPPAARQLVGGAGEWRVRTGDYRVVYDIQDWELIVLAVAVGHANDAHR